LFLDCEKVACNLSKAYFADWLVDVVVFLPSGETEDEDALDLMILFKTSLFMIDSIQVYHLKKGMFSVSAFSYMSSLFSMQMMFM
jgi:hypothetical protein